ncbi:host-nuclease inhibitor Gam family protein [Bacillus sp. FJAT-49736]|uniref:host-nuclease inhibitor Gam family protein n=1 Tax=Bacillus sp. FJAT-49736 TaxID=2833582 RepID=UPI001BC8D275|nr:host-nuclease inhibitor Gam family protein [Bacillus sp. FJAT-49736]MBS4173509.1 host-nuclease inhibitor Gam family protein [Bacillus sp. FJAT-49736]
MIQPLENILSELQEQEETQEVFAVINLETATEASRRIAYFEERKAEIDAITEKQIAPFLEKIEKIKAWGEESKKEFIEKQAHYSNQLEMYLREEVKKQVEAGKKVKKSIKLPYGFISLKKQQPEFVRDEKVLMDYAKANNYVKYTESIDWATIKKQAVVQGDMLVDEDGVIIPGIQVVERDEKFEIKLDTK